MSFQDNYDPFSTFGITPAAFNGFTLYQNFMAPPPAPPPPPAIVDDPSNPFGADTMPPGISGAVPLPTPRQSPIDGPIPTPSPKPESLDYTRRLLYGDTGLYGYFQREVPHGFLVPDDPPKWFNDTPYPSPYQSDEPDINTEYSRIPPSWSWRRWGYNLSLDSMSQPYTDPLDPIDHLRESKSLLNSYKFNYDQRTTVPNNIWELNPGLVDPKQKPPPIPAPETEEQMYFGTPPKEEFYDNNLTKEWAVPRKDYYEDQDQDADFGPF